MDLPTSPTEPRSYAAATTGADSSPKVSVVVVNYNQGRFLGRAVDSVLSQTFEDFEVILVDDGSRDDSVRIIHGLVNRYPQKLRFHHHPLNRNLGIARTYALGIKACRARYVAFLEADDSWDKKYLERKTAILDHHPEIGVVFSKYKIVSEDWYGLDMAIRQWILGSFLPRGGSFRNLGHLLRKNNIATFSAFVTRRSLLADLSLDLPPDILYLDWWILLQLSMCSRFLLDGGSVVYWRQHPESALGRQTFEQHQKMLGTFMRTVCEDIGRKVDTLDAEDRALFLKHKALLPLFLDFYCHPCRKRLLAFLRHDPRWALEALSAYLVNRWKYSRCTAS